MKAKELFVGKRSEDSWVWREAVVGLGSALRIKVSGLLFQLPQFPIVAARKGQLRGEGTDEGAKHIPLGVPNIPLCSQKIIGRLSLHQSGPPLKQLVECAKCQADRGHEEKEPLAGMEGCASEENLPGQNGGNKSLGEVAESIIVIAGEMEEILNPETDRNPRIGVMAPDHENDRMNEEKPIQQRGQRKAPVA